MKKEEARRNKRQRKLIFQFQFLVKIQTPVKTGSLWRLQLPQIFAKVDLLPIGNDSEKKKIAKNYKLLQIPRKLLVTLLLRTLHVMQKINFY